MKFLNTLIGMADSVKELKDKIHELGQELALKENQLQSFRLQLTKTNQQLEKMISQVSHELKMAGLIQRHLSPTELPQISGFEFSTKFIPGTNQGGDYFDIFEHDDRLRFGLILSSASGYSMSALFLTILMKLSSRIESRKALKPNEALVQIHSEMKPHLTEADRASLFYGLIDRRTYELHFASVGALSIYRQTPGMDSLEVLESQGSAISKDFNTQLHTGVLTLNSKDRLILCSEGVTQVKSAKGEIWGTDQLLDAIRSAPKQGVHQLRNEILYRIEKFSGKTEPTRDLTVLVMEVKDRIIKLAK